MMEITGRENKENEYVVKTTSKNEEKLFDILEEQGSTSVLQLENEFDDLSREGPCKYQSIPDNLETRKKFERKNGRKSCDFSWWRTEGNKNIERASFSSTGYEITVRPSGTFNANAGPMKIFKYGLDLRNLKGDLTEEIICRISLPTEAWKMRTLKEECLPTYRCTLGGTLTSDFLCEYCKKRHSKTL